MQNKIVYDCRDYSRYIIEPDGLWQINCLGPYNPMLMLPEYKPWTKEEKDSTRKFRK